MHTFKSEGVAIIHHSDLSGSAIVRAGDVEIEVPCRVLVQFVLEAARSEAISRVENTKLMELNAIQRLALLEMLK